MKIPENVSASKLPKKRRKSKSTLKDLRDILDQSTDEKQDGLVRTTLKNGSLATDYTRDLRSRKQRKSWSFLVIVNDDITTDGKL